MRDVKHFLGRDGVSAPRYADYLRTQMYIMILVTEFVITGWIFM